MILTCEECQTRYLLPTHLLGAAGRRVKCTICGHEWFQIPEESEDESLHEVSAHDDSVKEKSAGYDVPALADVILTEDKSTHKISGGVVSGFMAALFVGGIIFAGLLVARGPVMAQWPDSVALYDALGLAGPEAGAGLMFENMTATTTFNAEGVEILKVDGEVMNIKPHAVKVPGLRFALRTVDGQETESWVYDSPGADIQPQTAIPLTASYPVIGPDVVELNVRFTGK
ncbi:MAG: zinc-ribbon domain-containing protein [Alphaproteobacteria bacterium]|nr:zinc-ribbon domain-containing protein [Alphaproteobacteria bacterium]